MAGIGQALLENCVYDKNGQLLTGSYMDYAMPRADNLPFFKTEISEVPSPTHPLGMRPAGESGTTGALGVVINAIVDALAEYGVEFNATPFDANFGEYLNRVGNKQNYETILIKQLVTNFRHFGGVAKEDPTRCAHCAGTGTESCVCRDCGEPIAFHAANAFAWLPSTRSRRLS